MGMKPRSGARDVEVDVWLRERGHPQAALMRAVRKVILACDSRVGECIKWSCPTFMFNGNIVSFNPAAKTHVSLMFHTGGKIPVDLPQLTGTGDTCKYMRIEDEADLVAKRASLEGVVRAWCAWKE